jgi:ribonuclease M5
MEGKLKLKYPVVVEGKYDKSKLSIFVETPIITLDGFSVFNNSEKQQLLKRLARGDGIILLTDSDRAGNFIRAKLKGILKGKIYNVYAPVILGKERRKKAPSADGLLGVEGIASKELRKILSPFVVDSDETKSANIDKARFYEDGFSGNENSVEKRKKLAKLLSLPETLTSKALLEAINLLVSESDYINAVKRINDEQ